MTRPRSLGRALPGLLLVLPLLFAAPAARAQEARSLADFAGAWHGSSLTADADSQSLGVTVGDLDAVITPRGDGFTIAWTRLVPGGDAASPTVERRATTLTFRSADRPNVFAASDSGNPMDGRTLSWARLGAATLSVYQLVLNDHGGFELTSTDRTLDGDGMAVVFRRIRDGDPVRAVSGRATRTGG